MLDMIVEITLTTVNSFPFLTNTMKLLLLIDTQYF